MKIKFINPYNLICVLFLICIVGCSPDYETDFEEKTLDILNQDLAPITFDREGGEKEINVVTNVDQELWSASSNAEWCLVTKNNSSVVISADVNELFMTREALVNVSYGYQSFDIRVRQSGQTPVLLIDGEQEGVVKEVEADGGRFEVSVETNMNLDEEYISFPGAEWMELISVEQDSDDPGFYILTFEVDVSYARMPRSVVVRVQSSDNFNHPAEFTLLQTEREYIPVVLTLDMLSANATQDGDGQGLAGLIDGDPMTYYHTLWSQLSPDSKPHYVQIDLEEPLQFIRVEYDGRHNSNAGDVTRAGIWVSETGGDEDDEWEKAADITFTLRNENGGHYAQNEQVSDLGKEYKYIRFVPEGRRGMDPLDPTTTQGYWNMGNLFIYTLK